MNAKESFQKINIKKIAGELLGFFYWKISWILILFFLVLSSYFVFIWYGFVYSPRWNDYRKEEYIKNKGEGAVLDKMGFDRIISEQKKREEGYNKDIGLEDIFRIKR